MRIQRQVVLGGLFLIFVFFYARLSYSTDISACQTISSPGYYRLTADITSQEGDCIEIVDVSDVVVDCDGHKIRGNGSTDNYGIIIRATTQDDENISVINCTISNFGSGIFISGTMGFFGSPSCYVRNVNISFVNASGNTNSDGGGIYMFWYVRLRDKTSTYKTKTNYEELLSLREQF